MNTQLEGIANELGAIAKRHASAGVAEAICTTVAGDTPLAVLIVAANEERGLIARDFIDADSAMTITFAQLAAEPSLAFRSKLLVGVLECGEVISSADLETIEHQFITRPLGTYAFAFLGAERLDSGEERERAERAAWRLLVPEPKPRWAQQDLAEHRIFLDPASPESKAALARMSDIPEEAANQLAGMALRFATNALEDEMERQRAGTSAAPEPLDEIDAALSQVATLRTRTRRTIDTTSVELQHGMETSILRLRRELLSGLEGVLRSGGTFEYRPSQLRDRFQGFVTTAIDRWLESAERQLRRRFEEMADEVVDGASVVEWSVVNSSAKRLGEPLDYPARFANFMRGTEPPRSWRSSDLQRAAVPPDEGSKGALALAGTGGLMVALLSVVGPLPAVVTSLLVGAGGWTIYKEQGIRRYEEHGRTSIVAVTEQVMAQVDDVVREAVQVLRRRLKEELEVIERVLRESAEKVATESDSSSAAVELNAIRQLRRRLDEQV